jgi:predicted PurR-regulated permease PerM
MPMPERVEPPDRLLEQPGLTGFALLSGLLALFVLLPYLQYVLFGVVLAYILYPIQRLLERLLWPTVAAITVVVATLLVVLLPLVYVIAIAVQQSLGVVRAIRRGDLDVERVEALVGTTGYDVDVVAVYEANQNRIATGIQEVTMSVLNVIGSLPKLFIGLTVTLFVLFALLRDGERLLAWFEWVLPVGDEELADLREGLDELMWASVVGNVGVAAIQAVMLGAGLLVAGVPAIVFLTVATFVLTLLPLVGAFGVWVPASVYLVAAGRPVAGGALAVYGLFVTFSDSYLRPALIGQTAALNSAIIIVGIFGGLVVFGAVGLFIGPVVLGGAKLVLDAFASAQSDGPKTERDGSDGSTPEEAANAGAEPG